MLVYTESGATFAVCSLPGNSSAHKADSYWRQLNLTPYGWWDALNISTGCCIKTLLVSWIHSVSEIALAARSWKC